MNKQQQEILNKAAKTVIKNELILGTTSKYINPIRKIATLKKKKGK